MRAIEAMGVKQLHVEEDRIVVLAAESLERNAELFDMGNFGILVGPLERPNGRLGLVEVFLDKQNLEAGGLVFGFGHVLSLTCAGARLTAPQACVKQLSGMARHLNSTVLLASLRLAAILRNG